MRLLQYSEMFITCVLISTLSMCMGSNIIYRRFIKHPGYIVENEYLIKTVVPAAKSVSQCSWR